MAQRQQVVQTLEPGKAVLHMEFTPRGEAVWISSRDANRVSVIDTSSFATLAALGLWNILKHPSVLAAINPWYAVHFFAANHLLAFLALVLLGLIGCTPFLLINCPTLLFPFAAPRW